MKELLDQRFQMPIHFAAVGTNGSIVAGTYRPLSHSGGFDCAITVQTSDGLIAPVNVMVVDSQGKSAIVVLQQQRR